jgi:hypothetical protein
MEESGSGMYKYEYGPGSRRPNASGSNRPETLIITETCLRKDLVLPYPIFFAKDFKGRLNPSIQIQRYF